MMTPPTYSDIPKYVLAACAGQHINYIIFCNSLFNCISIFDGNLMTKQSLQRNSSDSIYSISTESLVPYIP